MSEPSEPLDSLDGKYLPCRKLRAQPDSFNFDPFPVRKHFNNHSIFHLHHTLA